MWCPGSWHFTARFQICHNIPTYQSCTFQKIYCVGKVKPQTKWPGRFKKTKSSRNKVLYIIASIHLKWIDEFIEEISVLVRVVVLYMGYWEPEELSPLLYINLSVAKNFPFYVQDICKVRSPKTCISTLLTINLQTQDQCTWVEFV
jgi:hypothetical protein